MLYVFGYLIKGFTCPRYYVEDSFATKSAILFSDRGSVAGQLMHYIKICNNKLIYSNI